MSRGIEPINRSVNSAHPKRILGWSSNERGAGFTLAELLVIIAIIAVLFSLQWAGLAGTKSRTRVAQCAANLKQFTMVVELYGSDNNNRLPANINGTGNWVWDLPGQSFNDFVKYGATRNMMFCPANPEQNNDQLWNYYSNYYHGGFHVIGYAVTFPGTPSLAITNVNPSLVPQRIVYGPSVMPPAPASKRVLLADATISPPGQRNLQNRMANQYTGIVGAGIILHRTAHLNGALPAGGNVGMVDGHVEWRKFNDMIPRTDINAPNFIPVFWW